MQKSKESHRRLGALMVVCLALSSCQLTQGAEYSAYGINFVQFRVVINNDTSRRLLLAGDAVAANINIDQLLRDNGIATTCPNPGTRDMGDSCVQRILASITVTGWLRFVGNRMWDAATRPAETPDIAQDSLNPMRAHPSRCMEVVITDLGTLSADWQTQMQSEQGCPRPTQGGW